MIQKSYDGTNSLYLIPTPIGNMDDITNRAIDTLNMVDYILCEDTRVSGELLSKLGIKKKLIHSDDHTEDNIKERVLKLLQEGNNIGLVTDRGTPIISDPGYKTVKYVSDNNFNVKCAGLPKEAQEEIKNFNQFEYGLTFVPKGQKNIADIKTDNIIHIGKLQQKLVRGGIKLSETIFTIKEPDFNKSNGITIEFDSISKIPIQYI